MSPEAQEILDKCLDLMEGKLEPREWCDIGHAIECTGLAHLPEERRLSVQAAIPASVERDVERMIGAECRPPKFN
jgi:hypothetical protein